MNNRGRRVYRYFVMGLLIILSICMSSCAGFDFAQRDSSDSEGESQRSESSDKPGSSDGKTEDEKKRLPAEEVDARLSFEDDRLTELFYSLPRKGKPVFTAVVQRRLEREEEYEYALLDIARQAALYRGLQVSVQFVTAETNTELGYDQNITVDYDTSRIDDMKERVEPFIHVRDKEKTIVKATVDGLSMRNLSLEKGLENGLPNWVANPPDYDNYYSAVGSAERHAYLSDSLTAADKSAMANLARRRKVKISNLSDHLESTTASGSRTMSFEVSEAKLEAFNVLARWHFPEENLYYSLAVCSAAD